MLSHSHPFNALCIPSPARPPVCLPACLPPANSNDSTKHLFKDRLKARTTPTFFFFRGGERVCLPACLAATCMHHPHIRLCLPPRWDSLSGHQRGWLAGRPGVAPLVQPVAYLRLASARRLSPAAVDGAAAGQIAGSCTGAREARLEATLREVGGGHGVVAALACSAWAGWLGQLPGSIAVSPTRPGDLPSSLSGPCLIDTLPMCVLLPAGIRHRGTAPAGAVARRGGQGVRCWQHERCTACTAHSTHGAERACGARS